MIELNTIFRLVCSYKLALFGNDQLEMRKENKLDFNSLQMNVEQRMPLTYPVDLSCGISVVQCSTCRFPHELENVYSGRALSTKLRNHPSENTQNQRHVDRIHLFEAFKPFLKLTFVSLSRIRKSPSCPCELSTVSHWLRVIAP